MRKSAGKSNGKEARIKLWREDWADYVFAFHDGEEIGSKMMARIAKKTGLKLEDL